MKDNTQEASSVRAILNDVDAAVAADRVARANKRKRAIVITIVLIGIIAVLLGYVLNKYIQNRRFKEELLGTAILVTSEYGVDDLTIVSVNSDYHKTVVFQSDAFANLSDKDKMEVFREFDKQKGTYSQYFDCADEGKVTIVSDGMRYTAKINEYGSSYYRYLYADGSEILKDIYTYPSSSSSSSSSNSSSSGRKTGSCSGGSVGCRAGFHPCHEMSNGFCNRCCKN